MPNGRVLQKNLAYHFEKQRWEKVVLAYFQRASRWRFSSVLSFKWQQTFKKIIQTHAHIEHDSSSVQIIISPLNWILKELF